MSGIVLSASVRQNLLSLQSTASLLATTQNDLATGNAVNSALDNPTNFFTAQGLNNRASDIGNLLDSIGNGVQVLQAANTGITSLQSLVASAQSIANQVLQTPVGYSTKSNITSAALSGATANNLLGTTAATSGSVTAGTFTTLDVSGNSSAATAAGDITGSAVQIPVDFGSPGVQFTLTIDGTSRSIDLTTANVDTFTGAGGTLNGGSDTTLTAQDVANIIDFQFNGSTNGTGPVSVSSGDLQFASSTTGSTSQVSITGLTGNVTGGLIGLGATNGVDNTGSAAVPAAQDFTVTVDGGTAKNIALTAANVAAYNTASAVVPHSMLRA